MRAGQSFERVLWAVAGLAAAGYAGAELTDADWAVRRRRMLVPLAEEVPDGRRAN